MSTGNEANDAGGDPSQMPRGHDGCGDEAQEKALHEIEAAKAEIGKAEEEIKHAVHDAEVAERHLEKAEEDLEEARRHEVIHFTVDGEEFETKQEEWKPNTIIKEFGRDPATNYLVEIEGHRKISFQGKGDIPIKLHDCERFQIISTGPTPVSDGGALTGINLFVSGLKALGYKPLILAGKPDHVVFDYTVETGKYAGQQVRLGLVVPSDFPLTSPGGPHLSPYIHPIKGGGDHPSGCIQESPNFAGAAGGAWQYWSRPFKEWGQAKKTVANYMSHIWRLWDSQ